VPQTYLLFNPAASLRSAEICKGAPKAFFILSLPKGLLFLYGCGLFVAMGYLYKNGEGLKIVSVPSFE
jgi:hypothetical protein